MNTKKILILLAAGVMVTPCLSQKRKAAAKKKTAPVVKVEEDTKFEEMLDATQKVIFIDSVVVDKASFLKAYRLTEETGAIDTYNHFFNSNEQPYATVYVNQLGNKSWYSANGQLFTSDRLNNRWSEPLPLEGLGHFQRTNYPFMLSDGLTLYFSAITDEGLGGLDIYVSRYDSEAGKFLLSENLGLPFNSDANDYMYAVDEFNNIGYFASDRRQPEGKVCIYTFIPNQKRVTYSDEQLDVNAIRSRAKIMSIADTWGDGEARQEALQRLSDMTKTAAKQQKKPDFKFVVNDETIYTSMVDFRNPDNHKRMSELKDMYNQHSILAAQLEMLRNDFGNANADEKALLKVQIPGKERKYQQLTAKIRQLEKQIRNSETRHLNQ